MPTLSVNSDAGSISPIQMKTSTTLRISVLDPTGAAKTITSYAFRALVRCNPGGHAVKLYHTSTSGGITIQSATTGMISIAIGQNDLPPMKGSTLELVEYSGKALSGAPTDRFRFSMPVLGGDRSY